MLYLESYSIVEASTCNQCDQFLIFEYCQITKSWRHLSNKKYYLLDSSPNHCTIKINPITSISHIHFYLWLRMEGETFIVKIPSGFP